MQIAEFSRIIYNVVGCISEHFLQGLVSELSEDVDAVKMQIMVNVLN